jgi:hypothetical protein
MQCKMVVGGALFFFGLGHFLRSNFANCWANASLMLADARIQSTRYTYGTSRLPKILLSGMPYGTRTVPHRTYRICCPTIEFYPNNGPTTSAPNLEIQRAPRKSAS